jgi:hypothetical protein
MAVKSTLIVDAALLSELLMTLLAITVILLESVRAS